MQKNDLIRIHGKIYRILNISENEIFIIDCIKLTMPTWVYELAISDCEIISDEELHRITNLCPPDIEKLAPEEKRIAHQRFSMISNIIPFVANKDKRIEEIRRASELHNIGKQSIRRYLGLYLAYQNISALAPRRVTRDKPLTEIEKTMRWGLNKFFYTKGD